MLCTRHFIYMYDILYIIVFIVLDIFSSDVLCVLLFCQIQRRIAVQVEARAALVCRTRSHHMSLTSVHPWNTTDFRPPEKFPTVELPAVN